MSINIMNKMQKDKIVLKLMAEIRIQESVISDSTPLKWCTNCMIDKTNLKTVTDLNILTELFGDVIIKEEIMAKSIKMLSLNEVPILICGYSLDDWKNDFINVKYIIQNRMKQKQLKADKEALNKLLSQDTKEEIELNTILERYSKAE